MVEHTYDHVLDDAEDVFREYMHMQQLTYLSGVGHYHRDKVDKSHCPEPDECLGQNPLDALEENLRYILDTLLPAFRQHKHEWNENGFCACGWDGNA
jgi:hypothetical protein